MKEVNLFKRLISRPARLDHPEPQKRIDAINTKSQLDQEKLRQTAKNDSNLEVRSLALSRLTSIEVLCEFLDDEQLATRAATQIFEKLDSNHPLMNDPRLLPIRIQKVDSTEEFEEITRHLVEAKDTANCVVQVGNSDLRVALVRKITNAEVLVQCERSSRNRDKQINRIARERLATQKAVLQTRDETVARAEKLLETANRQDIAETHYEPVRNAIERDWNAVIADLEANNLHLTEWQLVPSDLDSLKAKFPERQQNSDTHSTTTAEFADVLSSLKLSEQSLADVEAAERNWLEVLKEKQPAVELSNEFYTLIQELRNAIKRDDTRVKLEREVRTLSERIKLAEPKSSESWQRMWRTRNVIRDRAKAIDKFLEADLLSVFEIDKKQSSLEQLQQTRVECETMLTKI